MPLCEFCHRSLPTTTSLRQHQSKRLECRRLKERRLQQLFPLYSHHSAVVETLVDPPVTFNHTVDLPPAHEGSEQPSELSEIPRRGVTIEEVPDDEVWVQPFPLPKHAGHTFGQAKTKFEQIRDDQVLQGCEIYGPFADEEEWELAKWLIKNVGHNATAEFLTLPIIQKRVQPMYTSKDKFLECIDELPGGVEWTCEQMSLIGDAIDEEGHFLTEELELWMRDPIECVRELVGNPAFRNVMKYVPEKLYNDSDGQSSRVNEMWTAEWWWKVQEALPEGATVVPVILASDKTKLSVFRGDKSAWPVYLTIGNISKDVRRQANAYATILIGYIPVGKYDCFSEKTRSLAQYRTFHKCMSTLLARLADAGRTGIAMTCADGLVRWMFPILAAYVADYPEQCLIACCMENRCPICRVDPKERGSHVPAPLRTPHESMTLLKRHESGLNDKEFTEWGMRPIYTPFWADLPFSNIFQSFTPDLLHQLHKGVFKDHLVKWCIAIIGEKELDERFKAMTAHPKLRHFKNGISSVSQWTGAEHKAMEKVFVGLAAGGVRDDRVMTCVRATVDFIFYSSLHSHTSETLAALTDALNVFHEHKDVFLEMDARQGGHFNIPKLHSMEHYVALIRHFGSADGFNTESPERLHIDYAKNAYRASNKKDYTIQMTRWLARQEAVDRFAVYLDWVQNGLVRVGEEDGVVRRPLTHAAGINQLARRVTVTISTTANPTPTPTTTAQNVSTSPKPRYTIASTHSSHLRNIPALAIIKGHRTKYFLEALQIYLRSQGCFIPPHVHDGFSLFKQIVLTLPKLSVASHDKENLKNVIRATPPTTGRVKTSAQMDFALISTSERNDKTDGTALEGLRVALVRVIFQLPDLYGVKTDHPLAYIEWFTPFGAPDPVSGLITLKPSTRNHHAHGEIIPVDRIVRNCHLVPFYGRQKDPSWKHANIQEKCMVFTFNPYSDLHMFYLFKCGYRMHRIG